MKENSKIKVTFKDEGQDFLWWEIDENGKVVDCGPFQATTWCKCQVVGTTAAPTLSDIRKGDHLVILPPGGKIMSLKHPIEKVEYLK